MGVESLDNIGAGLETQRTRHWCSEYPGMVSVASDNITRVESPGAVGEFLGAPFASHFMRDPRST